MLTVFSTPKPFQGHIEAIQWNAIGSWCNLGEDVQVILIGDEPGIKEVAEEFGVHHLPRVKMNKYGTPILASIFKQAREFAIYPILCYVNADIIFFDDLLPAISRVQDQFDRFLMIGQRWDLNLRERIDFNSPWIGELRHSIEQEATLHPPAGSDYFIYRLGEFVGMPPFALGRAGWDNWMIYHGRKERIPVIDATESITIIHQNHDYSHLPDGKPHYGLPESEDNVQLAGGREVIFQLTDATWSLSANGLRRKSWFSPSLRRSLEAGLITASGPGKMARYIRLAFHPVETLRYFRHRLTR